MGTKKIFFLFLNQNICCRYSKEPSQWDSSFEHPKHMLKGMGKKILTLLRWHFCLSIPVVSLQYWLFPCDDTLFCLFDLILYVPVNNFSFMLGRVFLGWTSTKQGLMCLAQGHNTMMSVRLQPITPQSWVKHSTTEPPCSHMIHCITYEAYLQVKPFCVSKPAESSAKILPTKYI